MLLTGAAAAVLTAVIMPRTAVGVDIPAMMLKPSVNVVLSVADVERSKEFYGQVLKLKPMANLNLPGGFVMTRYQVGGTEIKLLHSKATEKTHSGKIDEAIGIRRMTLFFPDQQALVERFKAHGREVPQFEKEGTARGWTRLIASDPDGNQIELVVPPPGTSDDAFNNIELRLTVGDIEKSRRFYREFVGFKELEPQKASPAEGGEIFGYRHGNTTINLAGFGQELPKHSGRWDAAFGLRYIQYIVADLDAVSDFAKSSGAKIDTPIFPLGNLARIMFIADPDGIINEFVGLPKAPK
jgi:catechol 2,3-dioxygenase-like lactoylglutathione lyase family enzyme